MNGYIKLHRKSIESSVFQNPIHWQVWCWCLMKANHSDNKFSFNEKDIIVKRGSFITGIFQAVKELNPKELKDGVTHQKWRSAINYLKSTNRIHTISTNKFTTIFIDKYETYQQQSTNKKEVVITNQQQTNNKQITTNKNDKNDKEEKDSSLKKTNNGTAYKKKGSLKPFYRLDGTQARFSEGKWWSLPFNGGDWLHIINGERDIMWK